MSSEKLRSLVFNIKYEAKGIVSVELRPATRDIHFPEAEAGAHIDLFLKDGLTRTYSLTNPGSEQRYVIAVLEDKNSRGGSSYVHRQLRVGQLLDISAPRNHFKLEESAEHSVLVAGGIGITPIYAMLQRLLALGHSVDLIYYAKKRSEAAYVEAIEALTKSTGVSNQKLSVSMHFTTEPGGRPDLEKMLAGYSPDTHFYCCGPGAMLNAYERACESSGHLNVHMERFAVTEDNRSTPSSDSYFVELKKSGTTLQVQPGVSILDTMLNAGLNPDFSCREGICGACETKVLSGEVDHHDQILTNQERSANRSMMICVSRCKSGPLVLDA